MFFTLLIHMSSFISVRYYLLYDLQAYILCVILNYKNLQFKQFIDNTAINLQSSRNFTSIENIIRRCNPMVDLPKFAFNKKILSKVVTLGYNKFCS